ncbi:MAG: F0F1 ATP synthase subunit B [Deltaproteobacteria bacterium]|nr:F0F1 ATP synthase subunit B [Deltaproteobacteria bacterium]
MKNILLFSFLIIVIISIFFSSPTSALATPEAAGHGGGYLKEMVFKIINFIILVGILAYFMRKPVKKALKERKENIEIALEEAKRAKEDAERKYQEYEERIKEVDREIEEIKRSAKEEGEMEKERIIAQANDMAKKLKKQAEWMSEQELKQAKAKIRKEVTQATIELAEKLLVQNISKEDQKRLVKEYVEKMGAF